MGKNLRVRYVDDRDGDPELINKNIYHNNFSSSKNCYKSICAFGNKCRNNQCKRQHISMQSPKRSIHKSPTRYYSSPKRDSPKKNKRERKKKNKKMETYIKHINELEQPCIIGMLDIEKYYFKILLNMVTNKASFDMKYTEWIILMGKNVGYKTKECRNNQCKFKANQNCNYSHYIDNYSESNLFKWLMKRSFNLNQIYYYYGDVLKPIYIDSVHNKLMKNISNGTATNEVKQIITMLENCNMIMRDDYKYVAFINQDGIWYIEYEYFKNQNIKIEYMSRIKPDVDKKYIYYC